MLMSFDALCTATGGAMICRFSQQSGFDSVVTDSRSACCNSLFVPLRGLTQDGHRYIEDALRQGACCILADTDYLASDAENAHVQQLCRDHQAVCIAVKNTLHALQAAAEAYVAQFPQLLKIGVTGSNGKTTTKELLGSIFSQVYRTIINEGNLNSETGLPLSLFTVRKEHEVGIFELGMNRKGEIAELAAALKPNIAVITNIGTAHIGILGSKDAIAKEKKCIFSYFNEQSAAFVPEEDEYAAFLKRIPHGTVYGFKSGNFSLHGLSGTDIYYKDETIHFPLPGIHNVRNAYAAIAVAEYCGLSPQAIKTGLEQVKSLFGRSQIIRGPVTYLLDCYNANPDSMHAGLELCGGIPVNGRKIYLLASMKELGKESANAHTAVCRKAFASDADILLFLGHEMCEAATAAGQESQKPFFCFTEDQADQLQKTLDGLLRKNDFVFLKGSRSLQLEQFEPILQKERA